jgi:DNA-binding XRE family transcriptional regulator
MIVRGAIGVNFRPLGMPRPSPSHAKDPVLVAFGMAVRATRAKLGVSQEELAHLAGVDRSYMSSIERGEQNTGLMSIARIAAAMGVSVAELMLDARL